ncbi:hypothetical protein EV694_1739 [Volucribacter psittacicida]|uniref:Uncharacterized protein n=1 Tax=Volucribacter psittacicida TaxID=203482 RepID=A0A4R1FN39_9PAST|nr:hypothetical protein [Volucribacter psittacicida]TCJ96187.1 hypothetical protein EV694_1739 [Volucribacter psittacicida]
MLATVIFNENDLSSVELADLVKYEANYMQSLQAVLNNNFYIAEDMKRELNTLLNYVEVIKLFFHNSSIEDDQKIETFINELLMVTRHRLTFENMRSFIDGEKPERELYRKGLYYVLLNLFNAPCVGVEVDWDFQIDIAEVKNLIATCEEQQSNNNDAEVRKVFLYMVYLLKCVLIDKS